MHTIQANWEDEENNRRVELDVQFQLTNGGVQLTGVTPTAVRFLDQAGQVHRSVNVWTETGRTLLVRQAVTAGRIASLEDEIHAAHTVQLEQAAGAKSGAVDAPSSLPA